MISERARDFLRNEALPAWSQAPDPESVGVDFLGLRPVNLNTLGELTQGFNNVVVSARQHAILTWAAWRFRENLRNAGRTSATQEEFSNFLDAVETIQLYGQSELAEEAGQPPGLGYFSLPRLISKKRIPLRFEAYKRTHQTSAMAAVQYGPSAKPLGLDLIRGESDVWTATERRGVPVALALDRLLKRSSFYRYFEEIEPPKEIERNEALDLARNGLLLGPKLKDRPEREPYTTALFALDETGKISLSDSRRRTLALLIEIVRLGGSKGISHDNTKVALLASRFRSQSRFRLPEFLHDAGARWRIFQVRQLQRYALEAWLALAEVWMRRDVWNVAAMIEDLAKHSANNLPISRMGDFLGEPAEEVLVGFVKVAGLQDLWFWAASDPQGTVWNLQESIDDALKSHSPLSACAATLSLTLTVVKLIEAVVVEGSSLRDFAAQGDRRRISLVFFLDWWRRRSQLPLRQLLSEMLEELVLQQHVAVAVSRFDNEKRRLRFCNDELGWELLPGTKPFVPNLTPDRIEALLDLLCDISVLSKTADGRYVPTGTRAAEVTSEVARLCA
jgi:hypothetical protein